MTKEEIGQETLRMLEELWIHYVVKAEENVIDENSRDVQYQLLRVNREIYGALASYVRGTLDR